jgi:CRISPR/Cas system-associated endoribonuclease Cas2
MIMGMAKNAKWHEMALTPNKGEKMPMTEAHFDKVIAMRDELIFEQKDEIAKLKMKNNKLQQRVDQYYLQA